jgi:hypothetical protein
MKRENRLMSLEGLRNTTKYLRIIGVPADVRSEISHVHFYNFPARAISSVLLIKYIITCMSDYKQGFE